MARKPARRHTQAFESEAYLKHLMGLSLLLSWNSRWSGLRSPSRIQGPLVLLGELASQRFALGFPQKPKYGRHPFLAVQADEYQFFKRISWANAWADLAQSRLLLTSKKVLGDGENVEDIPSMGIGIVVDNARKLELLTRSPRLLVRNLWFDEEGPRVAAGLPGASLPLKLLDSESDIFPPGATTQERGIHDLIAARLAATSNDYLPYQGSPTMVSGEFQELVDPFDPSSVQSVRPD